MANRNVPRRPEGLSGQEEEALRTLEKGYDPDAGALPDQELLVHDDRDRKPGDGPVSRHEGETSAAAGRVSPAPRNPSR